MELYSWPFLLLCVSGAHGKLITRRVQTSKCHYTLVFKEERCPLLQSRSRDMHSDSAVPKELNERVNHVETMLAEEKLRTQQLSHDLAEQMSQLKIMAAELQLQVSNVSTVDEVVGTMRKEQAQHRGRLRNMEHKLGGLLLDVNEVNKQLLTREMEPQEKGPKQIPVEPLSEVSSCPHTPGDAMYTDCEQVYNRGHTKSGVYYVHSLFTPCPVPVYCDMDTPPGGWMTILKRSDGSVSFDRDWKTYGKGFGDVNDEHWIGLHSLFLLTNQRHYQLRVDLWDYYGSRVYAEYLHFKVDGERDRYRLHVSNHSGTAPDGLGTHNGMHFSTPDRDNDAYSEYHCAKEWNAGWWFSNCWFVILTGQFHNGTDVEYKGIAWNDWKHEQLRGVEMKMRPSGY